MVQERNMRYTATQRWFRCVLISPLCCPHADLNETVLPVTDVVILQECRRIYGVRTGPKTEKAPVFISRFALAITSVYTGVTSTTFRQRSHEERKGLRGSMRTTDELMALKKVK
jgi:hypothetical protein